MEPADRTLRAEGVESIPEGLWDRLRAEPERAPELIALAAAERFAAPAQRWVELVGSGPKAAEEARRKHVRLSTLEGAALGIGGWVTAGPDAAALVWIQCRMVFFIAASHGFDPTHPMRPAELLALYEVYETPTQAREALDGLGTPLARQMVERKLASSGDDKVAQRLLKLATRRLAKRGALRLVPFIASPLNAVSNRAATADLGMRALRYYGG
ncbi:MAG: EcsC family protein [Thermoleophilaceae bacterium]